MKCLGAGVEAVFVLGTAIKINFQSVQMRAVFYKGERAVLIPVSRVRRRPERGAENPRKHGPLITGHPAGGQISHQGGAVRAHGAKHLRIAKRKTQRTVATHGNTADTAVLALGANAIVTLDIGNEFADEKILVSHFSVAGVDVETSASVGCDNQELANFVLGPKIDHKVHSALINQKLRVGAEPVKEIQYGIPLLFRIITGGKNHAVRYGAVENLAGYGTAFGAAKSGGLSR